MIDWRLGVEVELLAPPGRSREDLAQAIASDWGGTVQRFFHPQSEPSKVPGKPVFHNLTLGFEVRDGADRLLARCVDDLTLQADLVRSAPPMAGWYRVISDDERLLRLMARQSDAQAPLDRVLDRFAKLFGTTPTAGPGGMIRVNDLSGASVAIAAPLPGERQRPCELVTAPMDSHQQEVLERLLRLARELGFTAPVEGATHLHFDATDLRSAPVLANLVQLLWTYRAPLRQLLGTNPNCSRLGDWPKELMELVSTPGFRDASWPEAQARLRRLGLTKYCDFNLRNLVEERGDLNTFEVRILPVWVDSEPILRAASLFVAIMKRALEPEAVPPVEPLSGDAPSCRRLLDLLELSEGQQAMWMDRDQPASLEH